MMKKRNKVDLPEDLVLYEIFSRLPATFLSRIRSTSKRCNALVNDKNFAKKHSQNAPSQSLVIMLIDSRIHLVKLNLHGIHNNNVVPSAKVTSQLSLKDPLSNSLDQVDIRNVFHCDGLLLCNTGDKRLVVWNPCSSETRWIQPRNRYKLSDIYALGYDNKSSRYKILWMYRFGNDITLPCKKEIYDFTSNTWRRVGKTKKWYIPHCEGSGVYTNGNIYWLAFTRPELDQRFLLSFDFSTKKFQSQSLPHDSSDCVAALSVVKEDQLCLLTHEDVDIYDIDVWIATKIESTGIMSWSKFLTAETNYSFSHGMSLWLTMRTKL